MSIRVIFSDKSVGVVTPTQFDTLLRRGEIAAFFRSEGWVVPHQCSMRGSGQLYDGPERRNTDVATIHRGPAERDER